MKAATIFRNLKLAFLCACFVGALNANANVKNQGGAVSGGGKIQAPTPAPMPAPQLGPVQNELTCSFYQGDTVYQFVVYSPGAGVNPKEGDGVLYQINPPVGTAPVTKHLWVSRRYERLASGELVYSYYESATRGGLRVQIRDHKAAPAPTPTPIGPGSDFESMFFDASLGMRGSILGTCHIRS